MCTMPRYGISLYALVFALEIASGVQAADSETRPRHFMVHPVTVTRKVQRDEPLPECFGTLSAKSWETVAKAEPYEAELRKTVRVALGRNEYESGQIVIKSVEGDLSNVRISVGALLHERSGAAFPPGDVVVLRVGYVETYNLWNRKQSLGWWPDPLIPVTAARGFDIKNNHNQPVLLRFHARPGVLAGTYRGQATVTADHFHTETLPVRVTVFDFTLPREQHFTASIPIWGGHMEKMYPGAMTPERKRAFLDFLLAHRISPFPLSLEETKYAMQRGMKQFCVLTLPKNYVPKDLESKIGDIAAQWRRRKWFGRAVPYVLLGDEPSVPQWPHILAQGRIVHKVAPRIPRMNTLSLDALFGGPHRPKDPSDAYVKTFDTLGKAVDYFILATGCYPVGKGTELAKERGLKVWWYSVADVVYIPTGGAHVRIHFWKQWKYRVPGWLHWGMTYWGDANIRGKNGKKWPAIPWDTRSSRSGDGYLAYPAPKGQGFWSSFRLETIRDGIEDYEYFHLLDVLTSNLKAARRAEFAPQIGRNEKLLAIDDGVVHSYREAAEDGAVILGARKRVARAIVASQRLRKKAALEKRRE